MGSSVFFGPFANSDTSKITPKIDAKPTQLTQMTHHPK